MIYIVCVHAFVCVCECEFQKQISVCLAVADFVFYGIGFTGKAICYIDFLGRNQGNKSRYVFWKSLLE